MRSVKALFFMVVCAGLIACAGPRPKGEDLNLEDQSVQSVGITIFELTHEHGWYQVYAWYPADASQKDISDKSAHPIFYTDGWLNQPLAKQYRIPGFLMTEDPSKSLLDAQPKAGQFPIILFNHGWEAFPRANMKLMEHLAQQGFIVMSLGHPGDSIRLKRANGDLVDRKDTPERQQARSPSRQQLATLAEGYQGLKSSVNEKEYWQHIERLEQLPMYQPLQGSFSQWVQRTQHLLNLVEENRQMPNWLMPRVNAGQIGLMGHSFGGAVSGWVGRNAATVLPTIVMDVPQYRFGLQDRGAPNYSATCYFYSTHTKVRGLRISSEGINRALSQCEITFKGSAHMNFTDLNSVTPLKWFGVLGPVKGKVFEQQLFQQVTDFYQNFWRADAG